MASALFSRITFNLTPIFPSDTNCPCCETIPVSPVSTFVIPVPSSFIPVAMYFLPSVSNPFWTFNVTGFANFMYLFVSTEISSTV